jgi:sulfoxide reductase heme-binding subunit YedZ
MALWFAGRAAGLVTLVLLTASVLLGIGTAGRTAPAGWPRFVVALVHRNLALLTVAFLALHVATSVLDGYVDIGWLAVVVPFTSAYEPFWLGLGAVALDLLLALVVTSLLRMRIGPRAWRAVHWAAYGAWPIAVVHGLGAGGADTRTPWILALTLGSVGHVAAAGVWRLGGLRAAAGERAEVGGW